MEVTFFVEESKLEFPIPNRYSQLFFQELGKFLLDAQDVYEGCGKSEVQMFTEGHDLESLKGEQNWLMMTPLNITFINDIIISLNNDNRQDLNPTDIGYCSREPLTI